MLRRCRAEHIEPTGRAERILGAARRVADKRFCAQTVARLPERAVARLEELVADDDREILSPDDERGAVGGGPGLLAELKADPGRLCLETLLTEIATLERVRALACHRTSSATYSTCAWWPGVRVRRLSTRRGCAPIPCRCG